jgi:DNA modification methylase
VPAIVLDPFFGVATTGIVAQQLGRDWIGIELSQEYVTMALNRIRGTDRQGKKAEP